MSHLEYPDAASLDARVKLHEECSLNRYGWQRWVMDHIKPHLRGRVLEVGTGPAYLWVENVARAPGDLQLVLSDRSVGMLIDARIRLQQAGLTADWVECDGRALPYPEGSFDLVIANHLLFLLRDPEVGVSELARVTYPGGSLCATTNHRDHLQELIELLIELEPVHYGHLREDEIMLRRERFNFVSGTELLLPYFEDVELITYKDGLEVDRVEVLEPWAEYWANPVLDSGARERVVQGLSERIAREGALRIRKNSGMFIASRKT
jgi:SAM-dependent methyltransferase